MRAPFTRALNVWELRRGNCTVWDWGYHRELLDLKKKKYCSEFVNLEGLDSFCLEPQESVE
jgi:hypothetical protein